MPDKRPIRKRGYHRALKRGEMWARTQEAMYRLLNGAYRYLDPFTVAGRLSLKLKNLSVLQEQIDRCHLIIGEARETMRTPNLLIPKKDVADPKK